jgi:hypothetical protein
MRHLTGGVMRLGWPFLVGVLGLALGSSSAWGQQNATRQASGVIEGRVTDAATGVGERAGARAFVHGFDDGSGDAYDTHVPLLLMGAGVAPGEYAQPASPTDIAPTLAYLESRCRVPRVACSSKPSSALPISAGSRL